METTTTPSIALSAAKECTLKSCTPHLMPFHIAYSGPAPVNTYFRPQPIAPPSFGFTPTTLSESQDTIVDTNSQQDASNASSSSSLTLNGDATPPVENGKHFVAAFRGRTVHGLEIDLPEGYTGLVLRAPSANAPPPPSRTKREANKRSTRRARQAAMEEEEEDDDMDGNVMEQDTQPERMLTPAYTFDKLTIWHPDIPMDTSRDEYFRALSEWTKLGAVVGVSETYPLY
ncbi:unnamed protein product [Somion occarium]|uniref:Uncharacterized protein n=1 Tax=Somion occarium TaxID=3059160 RepID=A0ABP1E570_9APHY